MAWTRKFGQTDAHRHPTAIVATMSSSLQAGSTKSIISNSVFSCGTFQ